MSEWAPWLGAVALVNALLAAGLWATRRHWLHPDAPLPPLEARARTPHREVLAVAIGLAVLLSAGLGVARLDQSFWDDEASAVKRGIHGRYAERDGEVTFRPKDWAGALWAYEVPNNHPPYTLLARTSLAAWRAATDAPRRAFDERAVRVPAWLLGFVSIVSLAAFLWRLGHPFAAVVASSLLAFHPWHLRYTTEARGYILVLALTPAILAALLAALERGTWRRWSLFAAAEVLLLWAFPGALWVAVFSNLAAVLGLAVVHGTQADARPQWLRWLVVSVVAAMVWLQLFVPNLVQLVEYMGDPHVQAGSNGARWLQDWFAYLGFGMPWDQPRKLGPGFLELSREAGARPLLFGALVAGGLVAFVAGIVRLWAWGGARRTLLVALLLPGPVTWLQSIIGGQYLFEWYLIFVLPAFLALVAIGFEVFLSSARGSALRGVAVLLSMVFLVGFVVLTQPARERLRSSSLQPHRESVLATRPELDPLTEENARIVTAAFTAGSDFYDPRMVSFKTREELLALMESARETGRPLYLNFGWHIVKKRRKPFEDLLLDPEVFEEVAVMPGFKPRHSRLIYRYRAP